MNNDSTLFYGGGGFGWINKAKTIKTIYVPIARPNPSTENIANTETVFKETTAKKRAVRKRATKQQLAKKARIGKFA